jgi:ATP-dependent Clp protease ATP-binding subunit ClpA/NTP pyrophosphatase (non-canonical NTP hydrolase)
VFDRFTDRSRKIMGLARQHAQKRNHHYIGTEHILLGIAEESSGVAANVLRNLGASKDGPTMISMGQLPFTPRCKKMLELSGDAATKLRHNYIGTEHLLLGLVRENEGAGAVALQKLNISTDAVVAEVYELVGATPPAKKKRHGTIKCGTCAGHRFYQHDLRQGSSHDDTCVCDYEVGSPDDPDYADMVYHEAGAFFDRYQEFTGSTAIYPGAGTGGFDAMTYVALKGAGECGEFAEKLGKRMRKKGDIKAISRVSMDDEFKLELAKELGDRLWYISQAATELGFKLSDIVRINVDKLTSRKQRGVLDGKGDNR